ncbi:MAG: protein kinase [Lachnospiraceae bacterium]|nr:protein kinase [Lachnospiraceae bacterium]
MPEKYEKTDNNLPDLWLDDYISNTYEYMENLTGQGNSYIVLDKLNKRKYILKQLKRFDENIYVTLKNMNINGVPQVYEIYPLNSDKENSDRDNSDKGNTDKDDSLVIIEEYIKGVTLTEYIEKNDVTEEKLVSIIIKLTDILEKLHNLNPPVIHRDIKPDNIILSDIGKTYLIDFNISRNYTGVKSKDTVIMGTAGFAAPEQFGFCESDARTDIYGLGATVKYIMDKCEIKSDRLAEMVDKATKLSPDDRFQNADELRKFIVDKLNVKNKDKDIYESRNGDISNSHDAKLNIKSYALPGFRSKNPLHMLVGVFIYAFLLYCTITYKLDNYISDNKAFELNANRIGFSLALFAAFLFSCNYLNCQNKIKWLERLSGIKRIVGIVIIDILLILITALIVSILVVLV